ncbi:hypothetical protein VXS06_14660 [Photobacterium toruni]|uniref:Phage protein n=1 Tax=Photobacterium toruni TaxID=1935446 RepID=A0ABU6LDK0_9GAMM|nr:hypothetical protein [Photobacterium toruni]
MGNLVKETYPIARKDYVCEASVQLFESMCYPDEFEPDEVEILKDAYEDYTIKKGDRYTASVCTYDGRIYTFKSKPEVLEIYLKYDINENYE